MAYPHGEIESKWQRCWKHAELFKSSENTAKPKYYVLDMFPYPSAAGLHVGHALGYTATDIVARYYRLRGYSVLHPMGWDAFGLPAEQHAIETGEHPSELTYRNIENYKNQLNRLGMSYDWSRELFTCKPDYYKWTQWIFNVLYERGLAYQAETLVNWCAELKTVLANEEVIDGKSERGGYPVLRVPMRQWMLKITDYAERLLSDLEGLDWPESMKEIQRNWIGKSEGARVDFLVNGFPEEKIEVFTTRPDTLFGATYIVLAPEHPLVEKITTADHRFEIEAYQAITAKKSDLDRTELNKDKSGEFTGSYAVHPLTGESIPIWISDYVLVTYGTGAIMAVPAHDERDHSFAKKFNLKIVQVVLPNIEYDKKITIQEEPFCGEGTLVHSQFLDGLDVLDAKAKVMEELKKQEKGASTVKYKFRDWLFSRQRYWGEPFPLLKNSQGQVVRTLRVDELPLTLPEVTSYHPTPDGKSPLAALTSWVARGEENNVSVFAETDTMPGAAGSSWYFLRFCDPLNMTAAFDFEKAKYWMPVDLYIGGQEHAVGHLLFSRFWTKVLFDAGICPVSEPFKRLVNQGMICKNGSKMSKSKGNGVNPEEVLITFGADSLRIYEMFMGPLTQSKEWDDSSLAGMNRFLSRVDRLFRNEQGVSQLTQTHPTKDDLRLLHKTIKKISEDIENLSFNTSVSQMMIFINGMYETGCRSAEVLSKFLVLLSPFAPHLAEELWQICVVSEHMSPETSPDYPFLSIQPWPKFDPAIATDEEVTIGVQINGKHRGEITLALGTSQLDAVAAAMEQKAIKIALEGKEPRKTIYVVNRILNFVV